MGIKGLRGLIDDNAPRAIKEHKIEYFGGRKIAIDASMAIYAFLIAVRQAGGEGQLTNDAGEVTSHLSGMLYRTIRMMEAGIKPIFVFDGKPPTLKSGELAKRKERTEAAQAELTKLQETGGPVEEIEKQQKRLVRASREQSLEVKKLLTLMGIPVLDAPCEAESTCSALVKAGLAHAVGTEDMDVLTFGCPTMLRHLTASESRKLPILEISYAETLSGLGLTQDQFIDMCILCGCDYTDSIKGIGPKSALSLIKEHGNMEGILAHLKKTKKPEQYEEMIPKPFPFDEARALFRNPDVSDTAAAECQFKWAAPDVEGLKAFLVDEKQFNADRVQKAIERLQKCKGKSNQFRMEDFFGKGTIHSSSMKRKEPEKGKGKAAQKKGRK